MLDFVSPRTGIEPGGRAAVAILSLLVCGLAHAGPNLIQNGGFEEGSNPACNNGYGKYWESLSGCNLNDHMVTSASKHSGTWSQRLGGPSHAWDAGLVRQVTPYNSVQEGRTYQVSVWIKAQGIDNPGGWAVFRCDPFVNDTTPYQVKMPQQEVFNYDWRLISWQMTIPYGSGINRLGAILSGHWGAGTVWYDDVSITEVVTGPPTISRSPAAFTREVVHQQSLANDTFIVQNSGGGSLNYTISKSVNWLNVSPTSGSSSGEADTITITYSTAPLGLGSYSTHIVITATDATNTPLNLPVTVNVVPRPIPGDFDRDRDVDQEDFGVFQRCVLGPGVIQDDPACAAAKLDGDVDVDQDDFGLFQRCMTGPNLPGNPDCAN